MVIGSNTIIPMVNYGTKEITLMEKRMAVGKITTPTVNCGEREISFMEKKMVCG
jgi:hypothetical protein